MRVRFVLYVTKNVNNNMETSETKICPFCGERIAVSAQKCRFCGEWLTNSQYQQYQQYQQPYVSPRPQVVSGKSKGVAALLAIFMGGMGISEFYLGRPLVGVCFLVIWWLFCWTLVIPIILSIIQFIMGINYLCMSDEAFAQKYN